MHKTHNASSNSYWSICIIKVDFNSNNNNSNNNNNNNNNSNNKY